METARSKYFSDRNKTETVHNKNTELNSSSSFLVYWSTYTIKKKLVPESTRISIRNPT